MKSERLLLRAWRADDLPVFRSLCADPRVMEWMPAPLTADQADAQAAQISGFLQSHGWGLWAVEVPGVAPFIGTVGLKYPALPMPFTTVGETVEMAWRLDHAHWGRGYGTEAAALALDHGFQVLGLPEIVAFTVPMNARSRKVMERIGLQRDEGGDFDHPLLPEGHGLRRHVLYRKRRG